MYETIELERRGAAATIRLNRPEALNAWTATLGAELLDAVQSVAVDDDVRAVCVTGNGRAFSSGADLRDITSRGVTPGGHPDVETPLNTVYHPILTLLRTMPKPVVAAVNGPAAGIGCSLALSCDIVVAAESAYLLLAFVNIGLVPDGGVLALITARAGCARAAEMGMLGERVTASDARRFGLVNNVLPDHELQEYVADLVDRLAAGPTRSYAGTKRQINSFLYAGLDEQLALEARLQQEMVESADFREGVAAFLEKRVASFKGE
ncbi:MAG TPA: enoyl-CoA hydratase [Solirubrobacteraceae bacterium]|nr:enoyl-CoA hydratase [Solirubrobacteraceae bacterium]